jgi:hypothetical protein
MTGLWFLPLVYAILLSFILGLALGVGALLHWWFPTIDFGIATLISVVAVTASIGFLAQLAWRMKELEDDEHLADFLWETTQPPPVDIVLPKTRRARKKPKPPEP